MRDDIYPEKLEEALLAKAASIDMDPSIAYDKAPLEFCICFNNVAINGSAAQEEWICEWSFGDNLKERGWTAFSLFPGTPSRSSQESHPSKIYSSSNVPQTRWRAFNEG